MYQYDGNAFDTFNTVELIHCCGTKHPDIKLNPRAKTFTIPDIAFLFLTNELIKNPIEAAVNINTNELNIHNSPLLVNIAPLHKIKLINTYIIHTPNTNITFPINNCLEIFLYDNLQILFFFLIISLLNTLITVA